MSTSFKDVVVEYNATRAVSERTSVCHAAAVNLNFEQTGNATACCYNRRFILGSYPKNTVSEIWEGARIAQLRGLLEKADLSQGCQLCQHQLESRNFIGSRASGFDGLANHTDAKPSLLGPMPRMMEFEISNVCNLECIMCNGYFSSSIRRNREKLEPMRNPYDDSFVEQLRPYLPYLLHAKFLGGEPFLNPLYYKIWDLIVEVNPQINAVITTNASIMNDKVRALLPRLRPTITISCDSLHKKTYESIRINADFATFEENLHTYLKYSLAVGKALAISVCPMQENWQTIPDILRFCNDSLVCIGFNTVIWPLEHSIKTLPKKKIAQIHKFLQAECSPELQTSDKWWIRFNYGVYQSMLNQIYSWSLEDEQGLVNV